MKVEAKEIFDCRKKLLWNIVISLIDYKWRSDLSKIEVQDQNHFTEYTKKGFPTYFTIIKKEGESRYELAFENDNLTGNWVGLFEAVEGKTVFTLVEQVEVKKKWMKLFAKSYLMRMQKKYLSDLHKKVEEAEKVLSFLNNEMK